MEWALPLSIGGVNPTVVPNWPPSPPQPRADLNGEGIQLDVLIVHPVLEAPDE